MFESASLQESNFFQKLKINIIQQNILQQAIIFLFLLDQLLLFPYKFEVNMQFKILWKS